MTIGGGLVSCCVLPWHGLSYRGLPWHGFSYCGMGILPMIAVHRDIDR
jgi:hypothetical protein